MTNALALSNSPLYGRRSPGLAGYRIPGPGLGSLGRNASVLAFRNPPLYGQYPRGSFPILPPYYNTGRLPPYPGYGSLSLLPPAPPPRRYTNYHCNCADCESRRVHGSTCTREHCCERANCGLSSISSRKSKKFDFVTKGISVRGESFQIRKSYLTENSKFEGDLTKYLEKKSVEAIPKNVVEDLVEFINTEECRGTAVDDLVALSILASNVGAKSVVDASLARIKEVTSTRTVDCRMLANICVTIVKSSKVDSGLKSWLKTYLTTVVQWADFFQSYPFLDVIYDCPDVQMELEILLGVRSNKEDKYRIL